MKIFALVCLLGSLSSTYAFAQFGFGMGADMTSTFIDEGRAKDIGAQPNGASIITEVFPHPAKGFQVAKDLRADPAVTSCRKQALQSFKDAVAKFHDRSKMKSFDSYVLVEMHDFRESDKGWFGKLMAKDDLWWNGPKAHLQINYNRGNQSEGVTYNITAYLDPSGGCKAPSEASMSNVIEGYMSHVEPPKLKKEAPAAHGGSESHS